MAARQRFVAPEPGEVDADAFTRMPLADWVAAWPALVPSPAWPTIAAFEAARHAAQADDGVARPCFVVQDRALLEDGLHYEQRVAGGRVATRLGNWHDLFNAMAWLRWPRIKHALNEGQCAGIVEIGHGGRTRAQCALTHFDEAGVIVACADADLLAAWDVHAWQALFVDHAAAWGERIVALVFGHALLEHALLPARLLVGKALVLQSTPAEVRALAGGAADARAVLDARVAAIVRGTPALGDPQQLRPLPLSGIPGWHASRQDAAFIAAAPCFQPLRPGRRYPLPH